MISIYHSNYKKYLKIHSAAIYEYCKIKSTKYNPSKLNTAINYYFGSIVNDLVQLIEASPDKLLEIRNIYNSFSKRKRNNVKRKLDLQRLYKYFVDNNTYKLGKKNYGAKFLAKKIDIFSCPYCNENFTYSYDRGKNRTFDWDHIYPKGIYPFFAISFFNLIPSCKVCNQIKSNEDENYLNLHNNFNNEEYFFDIKIKDVSFYRNLNKMELQIISHKDFKYIGELEKNIKILKIDKRYKEHKKLVRDILLKKQIFSDTYLEKLKTQFSNIKSLDNKKISEILYSVNLNNLEYYKRPFSKLTSDILSDERY